MPEPVARTQLNPYASLDAGTCSLLTGPEPNPAPTRNELGDKQGAGYDSAVDAAVSALTTKYRPDPHAFLKAQASAPNASIAPPTHGPTTEDLPSISAGTPAVNERHHATPTDLVSIDEKGHPAGSPTAGKTVQRLTPQAAEAFRRLREYAQRDGINVAERLLAYSTFRSDNHQAALNALDPAALHNGFRAKSGTSTHRTGNALDVTIGDGTLEHNNASAAREQLHQDAASRWLETHAERFGFAVLGVLKHADGSVTHANFWEPWHITYNPKQGTVLPPRLERESAP